MENRSPMSRQRRAKQFMPFAALKGYREALDAGAQAHLLQMEMPAEYEEEWDCLIRETGETKRIGKI